MSEMKELYAHCLAVTLVCLSDGEPADMDAFAEQVAIVEGNLTDDPEFFPEEAMEATK